MSISLKKNRRWLNSVIEAASKEDTTMPWAAKRIQRPAPTAPSPNIRIFPSAPTKYGAIAAR